jgi:hypothetical protein
VTGHDSKESVRALVIGVGIGAVGALALVAAAVFPAQATAVATVVLALSAVGFEAGRLWRRLDR